MPTVSIRVPDDLKKRMEEHEEIKWSSVLRSNLEEELDELDSRKIGHAVATSERLSNAIDTDDVAEEDSTEIIRKWRDKRYGGPSA